MAKELIRPQQFRAAARDVSDEGLSLNQEQKNEISALYEGMLTNFRPGGIIKGTVLQVNQDGVLVDIDYKSDGLIPLYEFSDFELKKLAPGVTIEVILDELRKHAWQRDAFL